MTVSLNRSIGSYTVMIFGYTISITLNKTHYNWLVVSTPLKDMNVIWDDYSQYMEKYNSWQPFTTNQISIQLCRYL